MSFVGRSSTSLAARGREIDRDQNRSVVDIETRPLPAAISPGARLLERHRDGGVRARERGLQGCRAVCVCGVRIRTGGQKSIHRVLMAMEDREHERRPPARVARVERGAPRDEPAQCGDIPALGRFTQSGRRIVGGHCGG